MEGSAITSPQLMARIAGFLYLFIIIGALFAPFAGAPSGMMRENAALPNAAKILASPSAYFLGGVVQLLVFACDIGVALLFYELLKPVNRSLALLAAFLRLVFVAIISANLVNHFAPFVLLTNSAYLEAFSPDQVQALILLFGRLRTIGFDVALVFFGFHCLLIGYLLFRSTFFPRILGLLLAIGGVGYLANIFANIISPALRVHLFPYIMLPGGFAELLLTLWLLARGVNVQRWEEMSDATWKLRILP